MRRSDPVMLMDSVQRFPHLPRVGIYCRVSSGLTAQLESLAAQISAYVQLSKKNHWTLVDVYIDVKSGEKTENRKQFQRMLNACRLHEIDMIITKSVSRFGRNTEEAVTALREIKSCGVSVFFDQENIDTGRDDSELVFTILSAFAEADNKSRSENIKWGQKKRLLEGTSELYFRKCYGYEKTKDGQLEVIPSEASNVQRIYELYLSGYSILKIQRQLEKEMILSPTKKSTWSKKSIENILTNDKYTGTFIVMKRVTDDAHNRIANDGVQDKYLASDYVPTIIPQELFDAVQEERARRTNLITDENGIHRKSTKYSSLPAIQKDIEPRCL